MNNVMQELRKLILENPELEIVPFVAEECVNPDYRYTMSAFSTTKVDEYAQSPFDEEKLYFKSEGAFNDFYDDYANNDPLERCEIPDEEIIQAFDALPWEKAILVYIDAY